MDNDNENLDNLQLGYMTFLVIHADGSLEFNGTTLRIQRLGDQDKLVIRIAAFGPTILCKTDVDQEQQCCQDGSGSYLALDTICPNTKTLQVNQNEMNQMNQHEKKSAWARMLWAPKLPKPPNCVPSPFGDCPQGAGAGAAGKHGGIAAMTPIKEALDVLFHHPELLTLDPANAQAIRALIKSPDNHQFSDVWQYISNHPMNGGTTPWATKVPIIVAGGKPATNTKGEELYQWRMSDGMREVIRAPLAKALLLARKPTALRPTAAAGSAANGAGGWTLAGIPSRYGLRIPSVTFDAKTATCAVHLQNTQGRHLAVYVECYADGKAIVPPHWATRLPAAAEDVMESDTSKFLGMLPPTSAVAGMQVPSDPTLISFALPGGATGARLLFGGLGMGVFEIRVAAAAALLTAVLDYAVPVILDVAKAGLEKSEWYRSLLVDPAILCEVIVAACPLITNPDCATVQGLLDTIADRMGTLLLGGSLATLQASIAQNVGVDAIANAAPVLGWAVTELSAQAAQPVQAQVSTEVLSNPGAFSLDLASLLITLLPDPRRGMWPDLANRYQVEVTYDGAAILSGQGAVAADMVAPISMEFPSLPVGGQIDIAASIQSAGGSTCSNAKSSAAFIPSGPGAPVAQALALSQVLAPLTASTRYQRRRTLVYEAANKKHAWQDAGAQLGMVRDGPGRGTFTELVDITLHEAAGMVGYAWRGGHDAPLFAFQNIGVVDPEAALKFSGSVFETRPYLVYDRRGSAETARSGTGRNFYVDPRANAADGLYHLREMTLNGKTPLNLNASESWGAFYESPVGMAVHPAGFVVGCSFDTHTVQTLRLPAAAAPSARTPVATVILRPGTGTGAVKGPVAVAVTAGGHLLVLEQDNARVQAFDTFGNSAPCFKNASPTMTLESEDGQARYLDMATGPDDEVYVLSYHGSDPKPADYRLDLYLADGTFLSRTTSMVAARLVVDSWRRIYTLDYQSFEGPGGRLEPVISQWIPTSA